MITLLFLLIISVFGVEYQAIHLLNERIRKSLQRVEDGRRTEIEARELRDDLTSRMELLFSLTKLDPQAASELLLTENEAKMIEAVDMETLHSFHFEKLETFRNVEFQLILASIAPGHEGSVERFARIKFDEGKGTDFEAFVYDFHDVSSFTGKANGYVLYKPSAPSERIFLLHPSTRRFSNPRRGMATSGNLKIIYLLCQFSDLADPPSSKTKVETFMNGETIPWFESNSYGDLKLTLEVKGPYMMDNTHASYSGDFSSAGTACDAKALANDGIDVSNYDFRIRAFPKGAFCCWAGMGCVGCGNIWIFGGNDYHEILSHEMGHNLGFNHASSLKFTDTALAQGPTGAFGGNQTIDTYGDKFACMGAAYNNHNHFNIYNKLRAGWLQSKHVVTENYPTENNLTTGVYTMYAFDHPKSRSVSDATSTPLGYSFLWRMEDDRYHFVLAYSGRSVKYPSHRNGAIDIRLRYKTYGGSNGTVLLDTNFDTSTMDDAPLTTGWTYVSHNTNPRLALTVLGTECDSYDGKCPGELCDNVDVPCNLTFSLFRGNESTENQNLQFSSEYVFDMWDHLKPIKGSRMRYDSENGVWSYYYTPEVYVRIKPTQVSGNKMMDNEAAGLRVFKSDRSKSFFVYGVSARFYDTSQPFRRFLMEVKNNNANVTVEFQQTLWNVSKTNVSSHTIAYTPTTVGMPNMKDRYSQGNTKVELYFDNIAAQLIIIKNGFAMAHGTDAKRLELPSKPTGTQRIPGVTQFRGVTIDYNNVRKDHVFEYYQLEHPPALNVLEEKFSVSLTFPLSSAQEIFGKEHVKVVSRMVNLEALDRLNVNTSKTEYDWNPMVVNNTVHPCIVNVDGVTDPAILVRNLQFRYFSNNHNGVSNWCAVPLMGYDLTANTELAFEVLQSHNATSDIHLSIFTQDDLSTYGFEKLSDPSNNPHFWSKLSSVKERGGEFVKSKAHHLQTQRFNLRKLAELSSVPKSHGKKKYASWLEFGYLVFAVPKDTVFANTQFQNLRLLDSYQVTKDSMTQYWEYIKIKEVDFNNVWYVWKNLPYTEYPTAAQKTALAHPKFNLTTEEQQRIVNDTLIPLGKNVFGATLNVSRAHVKKWMYYFGDARVKLTIQGDDLRDTGKNITLFDGVLDLHTSYFSQLAVFPQGEFEYCDGHQFTFCSGHGSCNEVREGCDCLVGEGFNGRDCEESVPGYPRNAHSFSEDRKILRINYVANISTQNVLCDVKDRIRNFKELFNVSSSADIVCIWKYDKNGGSGSGINSGSGRRGVAKAMNVTHFEINMTESYPILSQRKNHSVELFSVSGPNSTVVSIIVEGLGPFVNQTFNQTSNNTTNNQTKHDDGGDGDGGGGNVGESSGDDGLPGAAVAGIVTGSVIGGIGLFVVVLLALCFYVFCICLVPALCCGAVLLFSGLGLTYGATKIQQGRKSQKVPDSSVSDEGSTDSDEESEQDDSRESDDEELTSENESDD